MSTVFDSTASKLLFLLSGTNVCKALRPINISCRFTDNQQSLCIFGQLGSFDKIGNCISSCIWTNYLNGNQHHSYRVCDLQLMRHSPIPPKVKYLRLHSHAVVINFQSLYLYMYPKLRFFNTCPKICEGFSPILFLKSVISNFKINPVRLIN